jgi:hypothetical protein
MTTEKQNNTIRKISMNPHQNGGKLFVNYKNRILLCEISHSHGGKYEND